jgi:hypothetical protein
MNLSITMRTLNSTMSNLCQVLFRQAVLGQNFSNILGEKDQKKKQINWQWLLVPSSAYGPVSRRASQNEKTDRSEQLYQSVPDLTWMWTTPSKNDRINHSPDISFLWQKMFTSFSTSTSVQSYISTMIVWWVHLIFRALRVKKESSITQAFDCNLLRKSYTEVVAVQ